MAKRMQPQRPAGTGYAPVRSVRIEESVWRRALARAKHEGVTMSHVMATLVEGYSRGLVDLPRVQLVFPVKSAGEES